MGKDKTIQQVVAENVMKLRKSGVASGLRNINQLAKKHHIGNGTLERIEKAGDYKVSSLAGVAKMFNVEPWQLLVPDLDIEAKPVMVTSSELKWQRKVERLREDLRVAEEEAAKERASSKTLEGRRK